MNKLEILKKTIQYTASIGSGMIVSRAIKANVPAPDKQIPAIAFKVGTYGISGLLGNQVFDYVGQEFDDLVDIFKGIDAKTKEKK